MAQTSTANPPETVIEAPKSKKKMFIILAVVAVAIVGTLIYVFLHWGEEHTDNATFEAHVVAMAPRVSGYITNLSIDDNQLVKKGEVLAQIDQRDYIIELQRANGAMDLAQTEVVRTGQVRERLEKLDAKARSKQDLDDAIAAEKAALAQYAVAKADADKAQKNLADTQIISPIDGRITERSGEVGAYVQPGQRLFSIVGNNLWVVANYKETQLEHMKTGQRVDIEIDSHPDYKLTGKIDSIQSGTGSRFSLFPAENATGNFVKIVQRVPVKILLDHQPDAALSMAPGMSVEPVVHTAD